MYLGAVLEKLPEPKPDPQPEPTPEPLPSRVPASPDGESKYLGIGSWRIDGNGRYFVFFSGGSAKNMILYIDKESSGTYTPGYYGFGEDGYMVKGWATINGYEYYFDPDTGLMQTGLVKTDGVVYRLNDSVDDFSLFTRGYPYGAQVDTLTKIEPVQEKIPDGSAGGHGHPGEFTPTIPPIINPENPMFS